MAQTYPLTINLTDDSDTPIVGSEITISAIGTTMTPLTATSDDDGNATINLAPSPAGSFYMFSESTGYLALRFVMPKRAISLSDIMEMQRLAEQMPPAMPRSLVEFREVGLPDTGFYTDTANTWNAWTGVVSVNNTDNVPRLFKLEGSIRFVPYFADGVAAADVAVDFNLSHRNRQGSIIGKNPHYSIYIPNPRNLGDDGATVVNFAAILNPHDYLMSTCRVIHKATGRAGINISRTGSALQLFIFEV